VGESRSAFLSSEGSGRSSMVGLTWMAKRIASFWFLKL
jgi:hypothetical protein